MSSQLVSVVIPTFNRAGTIKRSIMSVLNQTYRNLEVIVVDDCSSDNTRDIVKSIKDKRIIYVGVKKNCGANHCRNIGISLAKGQYIAFQDSDDEWMPEKIEEQLLFLRETGAKFCFCLEKRFYEEKSFYFPKLNFKFPRKKDGVTELLFAGNFISTQAIIMSRDVVDNIRFDEAFPRFQDWDFAIQVSMYTEIVFLNKMLVKCYEQKDSISHNWEKGIKALGLIEKKYDGFLKNHENARYNFEYAKCKIMWRSGKYKEAAKIARSFLKHRINLKVVTILVLSRFGLRKERKM